MIQEDKDLTDIKKEGIMEVQEDQKDLMQIQADIEMTKGAFQQHRGFLAAQEEIRASEARVEIVKVGVVKTGTIKAGIETGIIAMRKNNFKKTFSFIFL